MEQPDLRTVFMFSGQGSHYFQMGRPLYEKSPVFRYWMDRLDILASELSGRSIIKALYHDGRTKMESFEELQITHPAIFMVEYAMAQTLMDARVTPDVVLGASLGMFVASALAGCMTPEEALTAVVDQARIVERHCEKGAMVAVLAAPHVYAEASLNRYCDLAAVNLGDHFVVATVAVQVEPLQSVLQRRQIIFQRLAVSFPFHSRWIEPLRVPFLTVQSPGVKVCSIPVACCARAQLLDSLSSEHLWTSVREPILFQRTMGHLESRGCWRYVDLGPAGTLASFTKRALSAGSRSTTYTILSPFGREMENLETAIAALAA